MNDLDTSRTIFECAPVGMARVSPEGKWLEVNQRFCEMTGYSRDELLAGSVQQITHKDDFPGNREQLARFLSGEVERYALEKRYICKDGHTIWAKVSVSVVRETSSNEPMYFIAAMDEITEYKRLEDQRRKAEEKWSAAFRQTPLAMVLFALRDERFVEVNDAFEAFTGYTREEAIGRTSNELNLFPESADTEEIAKNVAAGGRVRGWERRLRTKERGIRNALFFADPVELDGEPYLIGAALDITDRKRLQSELEELSWRLIKAQDEERKWIAAELTDSLGQSIAVISLEACQLARKREGEVGAEVLALCTKIQDVAAGIGFLSQSLHPSGLDYTGLPWAIEGLCRQFTHLNGLQVAFKHEGMPTKLAPEIALCLYRIAQEGLRNVVEHSGTRHAWMELGCDGTYICLDLWDRGVGFDVASTKAGLGLLTMRERCRRMNGWITIRRDEGTRIEVQIPLRNVESDLFHQRAVAEPESGS